MTRRSLTLGVSGLSLAAAAGLLVAGPLTPSGGPVASTYKTLTEVEPRIAINAANTPGDNDATPSLFKITQPGSYYLTGNVTGVAGKYGIEITAGGVSIDLNGFALSGVPDNAGTDGIRTTVGGLDNIAIRNGTIRNWSGDGIDLATAGAINARTENVFASGNGSLGIHIGTSSAVVQCQLFANAGGGVLANAGCTITQCLAYGNIGFGIQAGTDNLVQDCRSSDNSGTGITALGSSSVTSCVANGNTAEGILAYAACAVIDCVANKNTKDGIKLNIQCVIRNNACSENGNGSDGAGIHATGGQNRIEGNSCSDSDRGIDVDLPGNIIVRNTCAGNTVNWSISANNVYGPIIDRSAPASAAVNGNSAASTLGSTDPNANFTY